MLQICNKMSNSWNMLHLNSWKQSISGSNSCRSCCWIMLQAFKHPSIFCCRMHCMCVVQLYKLHVGLSKLQKVLQTSCECRDAAVCRGSDEEIIWIRSGTSRAKDRVIKRLGCFYVTAILNSGWGWDWGWVWFEPRAVSSFLGALCQEKFWGP